MAPTDFDLEIKPRIPEALERLHDLAGNLLYSWRRPLRDLFVSLDRPLWRACNHNPKLFLRRVDEGKLQAAARDPDWLKKFRAALQWYDDYCGAGHPRVMSDAASIAYFCAEFGFHESLPIYSGGLGILAGDHCKAASDLNLPFVAVGLLYHRGYFTQTIDARGDQQSHGVDQGFANLPIAVARDADGGELRVRVPVADREVALRIWQVAVGRVKLYLLDADLADNHYQDRHITAQLYGGDRHTRIQQEMVLGVGGVRALRALGREVTVWHINEGHAAFLLLERIREAQRGGLDFAAALEAVAAATVFTIHTPIPAGHDRFDRETVLHHFSSYLTELGIDGNELLALGRAPGDDHHFNMTALALRGSRFHNGVSRIHGAVAAEMESHLWPQVPPAENPVSYITNGVHTESFLDRDWVELYDKQIPEWREHLNDGNFWHCLNNIDDNIWWRVHRRIKRSLLREIAALVSDQHRRNGLSQALIERSTAWITPPERDVLVIGFARRFATYKRASLLFLEAERLARLVADAGRPVVFIFAGKAHPDDEPGRGLIHTLYERSLEAEFVGRVILLEGYDIALARRLVAGCDIWLNTPEYPREACGTSGQKAGINGVVNLSIRDGWWDEGYNGANGWAVAPHGRDCDPDYRNRQEAVDILDIIEHQVVPAYYQRGLGDFPAEWVRLSKASVQSTIARFSARRMVQEYADRFYRPAARQGARLNSAKAAQTLADWKRRVLDKWPGVGVERLDAAETELFYRQPLTIRVRVDLNDLDAEDVQVECVLGQPDNGVFKTQSCRRFTLDQGTPEDGSEAVFALDWTPESCGVKHYRLRVYPYHPLLSHPFELGCMLWL